jgi:glutathione S-transferase
VKLYDSKMAPNPRRVRVFLAEKGIDVPRVEVNIGEQENLQEAFLSINSLGRVPVLELDDGTHIAETVAICRYFEGVQPEPSLFGVGPEEQATVEMWQRRMEFQIFDNVTGCFRNTHDYFKGRIEQVPEYGEVCRRRAEAQLAWLDGVLADREFIAGDRFTIADITAMTGIDFGRITKIGIRPDQKHLARWHEAVSARPSAGA